jgi:spore germination protein GerM
MISHRYAILGVLVTLLAVLIIIFIRMGGKGETEQEPLSLPPEIAQSPDEPQEKKKIVLFYLSEKDALLHPEIREIYAYASVVQEAKQTVEELLKESQNGYLSPIPPQTKLREIFMTRRGIAYVDFSKDFQVGHPSGSTAEILTIYSIVNSLAYNFKSIKKVFILIEGAEKETLGGHVNLNRSFIPQYSLIAK